MRKMSLAGLVLLAAVLLTISGCVELTGQRITWFYDSAKDELQVLVHYDGIHDSGSDQHGKGAQQLPKFVANGDVLIMDWPFHLEMAEVKKAVRDENADPRERDWARLLTSIHAKPLGYYREPDGRIGAAQLVTIPKAKDFLRKLNNLISSEILDEAVSRETPTARTEKRMQAAAKAGHQWLTLDEHAIRFTMPVHPEEWARLKGEFLEDLTQAIHQALGEKANEEQKNAFRLVLQALASAPASYLDEGDRVTFVVGRPKSPSTLRLCIRDEYEPSLEKLVVDTVKIDLDKTRAEILRGQGTKPPAEPAAVLSWGPPEDQVRALLVAAEQGDDQLRAVAIERLRLWAKEWNRDHGVPRAPERMDQLEDYLKAWKTWYGGMKQYPFFKKEQQETKPADPKPA